MIWIFSSSWCTLGTEVISSITQVVAYTTKKVPDMYSLFHAKVIYRTLISFVYEYYLFAQIFYEILQSILAPSMGKEVCFFGMLTFDSHAECAI